MSGTALHGAVVDAAAKGGESVKAGPIGLAVILILCIACYFLFKSMSRHMRNVRENFPVDEPAAPKTSLVKPVATTAGQSVDGLPADAEPATDAGRVATDAGPVATDAEPVAVTDEPLAVNDEPVAVTDEPRRDA